MTVLYFLALISPVFSRHFDRAPNIVIILADDLGFGDVSFHGSTQIPTPNIDVLASDGIVLNQYYAQPLCSPSRAALMTGRYPIHTGMQHETIEAGQPWGLPLNFTLMPHYLKKLGYETHMIGKWHLGYFKKDYLPTKRGFDSFFGPYGSFTDYYNHTVQLNSNKEKVGLDLWKNEDAVWNEHGHYITNLITEKAVDVIRSHDTAKPLFLYMCHNAVHSGLDAAPLRAPVKNVAKFPYIRDTNRTLYAGMVDSMDESVGAVFEALERAGMLNNTVVVFSSDNGGATAVTFPNYSSNWPLRGIKKALWEGGVRVAGFVWSPLLKKRQRVANQMMHIVDWLPTLYGLAGGKIEDLGVTDGHDVWAALSQDQPSPRDEILLNIDPVANTSALRFKNYKIVLGTLGDGSYDYRFARIGGRRPINDLVLLMLRSKAAASLRRFYGSCNFKMSWKLRKLATVRCDSISEENVLLPQSSLYLFDVNDDPCELRNIAADHPDIVELMLRKMNEYVLTMVKPGNVQVIDPRSFPEYHNGTWAPWE